MARSRLPVLGALAVLSGLAAMGVVETEGRELPLAACTLSVAALAPLVFALLVLAREDVRPERRPLVAALLVGGCHVLASLAQGRLDPYALALVVALAAASVASGSPALVGLALFAGLDLRWFTRELWQGPPPLAYAWWALAVSVLVVLALDARELGWRAPEPRDAAVGLAALLAFGALAVPLGLAVGFLKTPHAPAGSLVEALGVGLGYLVLVATPEELFFRGLLDRRLSSALARPRLALALSSLAFGLVHWNNAKTLGQRVAYCALAAVAGVFYGVAARRGGLPASILCHALVDTVWKLCLR